MFQASNLSEYLAQGFPIPLIYFYSTLLAANWVISLYRFQRRQPDTKCIVMRVSLLCVNLLLICAATM